MTEVVSIRFRDGGKLYDFAPEGLALQKGDIVVVQTAKGLELGTVFLPNREMDDKKVVQPLRPVVRRATEDDLRIEEACRRREREGFAVAREKIAARGLEMKLVDVECSFDGSKITFFFSSDGRVDFRELVKDLAAVFHTRIELRQIGVRDEARMIGGLGICGREFCCRGFMCEFLPVSTKMAKIQALSLNPTKISGACGRLMCCLRHEHEAYLELVKNVPKMGAFVETPDGYGNVNQIDVLRQTVRVKLDTPGDDMFRQYDVGEVAAIPGGRPRDGSQPPHILVIKPKPVEKKELEPEEDPWLAPERLIVTEAEREQRAERGARRPNGQRKDGQRPPRTEQRPRQDGQKPRQNRRGGQRQKPRPPKDGQQNPEKTAKTAPAQAVPAGDKPAKKKPYYNKRRKGYRPHGPKPDGGGQTKGQE